MRSRLACLACVVVLGACGSGPSSDTTPLASGVLPRASQASASVGIDPATMNRLFDYGELRYPGYFPGHETNRFYQGWNYRYYPQTGIYLGTRDGGVYVMGGPFGNTPLPEGLVSDYVTSGATVASVEFAPLPASITAGDFVTVAAVPLAVGGKAVSDATVTWQSADPAIAQVTQRGLIMVTGAGTTTVTAVSGTATASVSVHAQQRDIPAGQVLVTLGPEETVFDYDTERCTDADTPDIHTRAVRMGDGSLLLLSGNDPQNFLSAGGDFGSLRRRCQAVLVSRDDLTPQSFHNREWLNSIYREGDVVHGLVNNEYHDSLSPGCEIGNTAPGNPCWYNSITYARSIDGARSFSPLATVSSVVAPPAQRWDPTDPAALVQRQGYFEASNIVARAGWYYSLIFSVPDASHPQQRGLCVMRTDNLSDPASWRAWDGRAYALRMANPYETSGPVPTCKVVFAADVRGTLTWNEYLQRFMLVDIGNTPYDIKHCWAMYSLSPDLIHWTPLQQFKKSWGLWWNIGCTAPAEGAGGESYASIIDHASRSTNFETVGQTAYLYFTRSTSASSVFPRNVIRQPLIFLKSPSFTGELGAPIGYLDHWADVGVLSGATANVGGWAYDPAGLAKVEVWVDATHVGNATTGLWRPDVPAVFPALPSDTGWSYPLVTTVFANGPHEISIKAVSKTGGAFTWRADVTVQN